jgi:quercetin dioxygenase-like cupin family protein
MFDEPEHSAIKLKSRPNAGTATRRGAERTKGEVAMIMPVVSRRSFNRSSLISLLAATAATSFARAAAAQQQEPASASMQREVIKQELPGEPSRDLILVEVTYPPGAGSPPHLHANGVMAFVVSGTIASKVNDEPEQTFHAGSAWWEAPGSVHRISRNASATEPARLLAIYIAPQGATATDLYKPL